MTAQQRSAIESLDARVLILAPTRRDADLTQRLLVSARITLETCGSFGSLVRELHRGAAAILLPEEAISPSRNARLREILAQQPPWSDLPILVLTRQGADSVELGEAVRSLGNVTVLERPLRVATLLSAVRTALRARARQYQIRGHLAERARTEDSLRIADRRKDEFLATLGHELRNPLAPLLTAIHLFKQADIKDPMVLRVTEMMERQITHLVRLVDDLLEVSRITRGVIEVKREPLDVRSVIRSAIDTSRPVLDAAEHELTVDVPSEPITIAGDAVRLTQVFSNLLTNAAKYTNPRGHVWLAVRRDAGHVVISVRDNGIGLPPAQLDAVFDMFTQVDRASHRTQGGLGIGLTLVRSLVGMHGGHVHARSAGEGSGSEFIVELPLLDTHLPAVEQPVPPSAFPSRRVLIVDDNSDAAHTLGTLLTTLGATVSVVQSGRSALEILDEFQPDAVLVDIEMPDMDGWEVCRRIRARADGRPVLLIALTGWGQEHDQRQSRIAGFDHHLVKPPDINHLRSLLT